MSQACCGASIPLPARILCRRVLWLLACYVAQIPSAPKRDITILVMKFLSVPDAAVALTAVDTAASLIGDMDFQGEWLDEALGSCVEAAYAALERSDTLEGKLKVMDLVSTLLSMVWNHCCTA